MLIPLLSRHARLIYLLNNLASSSPSPSQHSLLENLAKVRLLPRWRHRNSSRRAYPWIGRTTQRPSKSGIEMCREMETLEDFLCEPGHGEGRRALVIYATWQRSPGLNIPGEQTGNTPSAWQPRGGELREGPLGPPGSRAAGTRRERQRSGRPYAGVEVSSLGLVRSRCTPTGSSSHLVCGLNFTTLLFSSSSAAHPRPPRRAGATRRPRRLPSRGSGVPLAPRSPPAKPLEARSLSAPDQKWFFSEMEVVRGVGAPPLWMSPTLFGFMRSIKKLKYS